MKVIIFCGGLGTRLGIETKKIPKPMVKINGIPIIERIMNLFFKSGYNDFILATGYKSKVFDQYFKKKKKECHFLWAANLYNYERLRNLNVFIFLKN